MATSIYAFTCSVPAGSNPANINMTVGVDPVTAIRWRVPPGPRGNLTFGLAQSGVIVIPQSGSNLIMADDEWDTWPVSWQTSNQTWTLVAFNAGTLTHDLQFQFYLDSASAPGVVTTGDVLTGFPTGEGDIPTLFL